MTKITKGAAHRNIMRKEVENTRVKTVHIKIVLFYIIFMYT